MIVNDGRSCSLLHKAMFFLAFLWASATENALNISSYELSCNTTTDLS